MSTLSILKVLITQEHMKWPELIFVCVMVEIGEVAHNFISPFFIESPVRGWGELLFLAAI